MARKKIYFGGGFFLLGFGLLFFASPYFFKPIEYNSNNANTKESSGTIPEDGPAPFVATHIGTPEAVRGVYMTACVAGTPSLRDNVVKLIEDTELNSIIIDIKDYTGTISFKTDNLLLEGVKGPGCRVSDMKQFIEFLHKKGIYVVGRITVFQDPYYSKLHPNLAIKKESDKNVLWKDKKGINYIDPGAKDMWDYIVSLSNEAYSAGFDEINFDYIRFPSDGNMSDIYYPFSEGKISADIDNGKAEVLKDFFAYLHDNLKDSGAKLSADLFGMTTINKDDLNIGQILEYAEPYFDFIAPMVYPSHYPKDFMGYENVNAHPYEIVKFSMDEAAKRLVAATSTPLKLRPWLQDNDYPVHYTSEMVRAQIQATYDAGLTSWMLWDAANTYTREALEIN